MKANHRFQVRNVNEQVLLEAIEVGSRILEETLGLQNIELMAQRQVGWAGADAWHLGSWEPRKNLLKINFRNLYGFKLCEILEVLGHEFRHAVQSQHGVSCPGGFKFVSQDLSNRYMRWINRPEEVDAINHQELYAKVIMDNPEFKQKFGAHYDLVEGTKNQKPCRESTYARLNMIKGQDLVCKERGSDKLWIMRLADVQKFDPKCKRLTQKYINLGFQMITEEHREYFEYDMVDVEFEDLLS